MEPSIRSASAGLSKVKTVGLHRDEQLGGRAWKLAEHGLTADDDELLRAGDGGCSADDVLKLRSLHGTGGWRPLWTRLRRAGARRQRESSGAGGAPPQCRHKGSGKFLRAGVREWPSIRGSSG